jgi:hypothetical protein
VLFATCDIPAMNDLIYIGIVVVFFIASGLYIRFCEKL